MKIRFVIFCALCLASMTSSAQTLKAYLEAAEESMQEKDYYSAFVYYQIALEIDSSNKDIRYDMAEAARKYQAYETAEEVYATVMKEVAGFGDAAFWLGYCQHIQGKYDSAIASYQIFMSEAVQDDDPLIGRAEFGIQQCQWALEQDTTLNDSIKVKKLDSLVNTNFSEVAAIKRDEIMYFSRLGYERKEIVKKREVPPSYLYSKVLAMEDDSTAVPLDSTLNDSIKHTAHTTFNHDGSRVFYTLCRYLNKYDIRCDIYFRDIDSLTGEWGAPQRLPEPINGNQFTSTQPSISYDDLISKDVMYFVSDREGGEGGLDIWYVEINDDNTFTEPVNLDTINTPYDDLTPFFHEETNKLFFSSDGWLGYGGYDILSATQNTDGTWQAPENLGPEYNSSYNDVYYTMNEDESYSLFSSNKPESAYLDAMDRACCYDIYQVEKEPIEVKLIVETFNKMTGEPLTDVTLYIEERNGEVIQVTHTTGATNKFEMELRRNRQWNILGEKRTFNPDETSFTTYNITKSQTINKKLYLDPSEVVVQVRTFELRRRVPLLNVTVDLLDTAGTQLAQNTERYSHISYFKVRPDENYGLVGWRKGYLKAYANIDKEELIGQDTIIKDLYLELGNLEDFLPLAIYFDNNQPSPSTTPLNTDVRYLQIYDAYYGKKDEYLTQFTKGLSGSEEDQAEEQIQVFFEDGVKLGREEFAAFLNILDQYLEEDLSFKIFLKGYASPLASAAYNEALGARRIKTIQNEFAAYKGGVLQKYFDSGDLEVTEKSFGEGTAPPGVSDDARDKRSSIYSPGAARERRVEIIEIQKDNPDEQ